MNNNAERKETHQEGKQQKPPEEGTPFELDPKGWVCAKLLHLCLTLSDPMDCRPPGSSIHGISQARILEWVARPSW